MMIFFIFSKFSKLKQR